MHSIILTAFKLAGAICAFALLFHFVPLDQVRDVLAQADPVLVCLGVLAFLGGQVVAAARWRRILRNGEIDISLNRTLQINLIGTFAGNFLPGMATGDLAKSALLFRDFPDKRSFLISSVVYDRIFGLAAILILMLLGTTLHGATSGEWVFAVYSTTVGLLFILAVWLLTSGSRLIKISHVLPAMFTSRLAAFLGKLQQLLRAGSLHWYTLALSLVFQLCWVVSQWLVLCALAANAPFVSVLTASTFSLIVAMLPVSLNGLGLREGSFSYVLQQLGIDPQIAVAAALLSLIPILVSSLIGGALLGLSRRYWQTAAEGKRQ